MGPVEVLGFKQCLSATDTKSSPDPLFLCCVLVESRVTVKVLAISLFAQM